jgi:hypothetical protein
MVNMWLCYQLCQGMEGYTTFLDGVNNLPMCETLSLSLAGHHYYGCVPIILHVLKRHNGIRKFVLLKYPTMVISAILNLICSSNLVIAVPPIQFNRREIVPSIVLFRVDLLIGGSRSQLDLFFKYRALHVFSLRLGENNVLSPFRNVCLFRKY